MSKNRGQSQARRLKRKHGIKNNNMPYIRPKSVQ